MLTGVREWGQASWWYSDSENEIPTTQQQHSKEAFQGGKPCFVGIFEEPPPCSINSPGWPKSSVSEEQIENESKHARKSFSISPISRRSPQYVPRATSDMTKDLDQHNTTSMGRRSFHLLLSPRLRRRLALGFPRLSVSGSSHSQCTWDSEVSRRTVSFSASRIRKWAKARFASRERSPTNYVASQT